MEKVMTRNDVIDELMFNLQVKWVNHGTWKITSMLDGNKVSMITHNEEDYTGIFDGEKYNPVSEEELADMMLYAEDGTTEDEVLDKYWSDTANEDNYETMALRDERLANKLLDYMIDNWIVEEYKDNIIIL